MWRRARQSIRRYVRPGAGDASGAAATAKGADDATLKVLKDIRWELQEQRKYFENFRKVIAADVLTDVARFTDEHQLGFEQTLEKIAAERVSFARFGDGEFTTMLRPEFNLRFQPWSAELAADLRAVLTLDGYDSDRLMLGFPYPYRNVHWSGVWLDIWSEVRPLLDTSISYGNSHVSRPVFFQRTGNRGVELWRNVWDSREICIVTGENSRFTLEPALFDNVKSSRFVHSTPVNAYADLPRLMQELEKEDPDQLYLISLGPTGTLLAALLSRMGRWAIDIGHISDSWANVFAGGQWPESKGVKAK
ncbi:GT-D fold domain-containing glycosyltransferase [Krasilnikovia sp. MM14-A1259]|uniref:GT-D fold domain-containing glycosyltransferase n=1 Tax=Krasilnikovia sp. MM14-A1259 TaxID=3373539 RepID=UPI003813944D